MRTGLRNVMTMAIAGVLLVFAGITGRSVEGSLEPVCCDSGEQCGAGEACCKPKNVPFPCSGELEFTCVDDPHECVETGE